MHGMKLILVLVGLALAAFAAAFFLSRYLGAPAAAQAATEAEAAAAAPAPAAQAPAPEVPRLEEKHLFELIKEARQKINDCQKHEREVAEQDKRLQMTRQLLEKETQDLDALRAQLTADVTRLKEAQAEMDKTRVAIDREEAVNLKRVAAVYDRMDAAAGGRIMEGMCANKQEADVVKILHYMTERAVGKILAEITDKNLAGQLCEQMKKVKEQDKTIPPATGATR